MPITKKRRDDLRAACEGEATPNAVREWIVSAEVVEAKGMTPEGKRTVGLESQTRHWPTPYGFQAGNGPDGNEFSAAVRNWPTPDANAMNDGESLESGFDSRRLHQV